MERITFTNARNCFYGDAKGISDVTCLDGASFMLNPSSAYAHYGAYCELIGRSFRVDDNDLYSLL